MRLVLSPMAALLVWLGGAPLGSNGMARAAPPAKSKFPSARARFTERPPRIDGRLDDVAWRKAKRYSRFIERKPLLGRRPPERTEFALLFDARALYVAVWCYDSQPSRVRGRTRQRDTFAIFEDDAISIKLDPAHDHRTTLGFAINPSGARLDYRGINESDFRQEFDALWTARARRTRWGWAAEFRIPLSSLGIDPRSPPARVGLNFSRDHPRRNATYDWALMRPPLSPISASRYGHLTGLDELPKILARRGGAAAAGATLGYAVIPYLLVGLSRTPAQPPRTGTANDSRANAGVDAWLNPGPRLRLQLTVNTDFSQVDVDDQIVNLTRFGLFFPEKRDFFLRDLELFSYGRSQQSQLLYTRRIGLRSANASQSGDVPILGGLKVVSRPVDALRVGVLQLTTRASGGQPWTSFLVARSLVELDGGSNVGVIVTHRQSLEDRSDHNIGVGIDANWRSQTTPLLLTAYGLLTMTGEGVGAPEPASGADTRGEPADRPRPAAGVELTWRGLLFRPQLVYLYSHPQVRADLGFFQRVGVHDVSSSMTLEPRIQRWGLERLTLQAYGNVISRAQRADLLDYKVGGWVQLTWIAGWSLSVSVERIDETVLADFQLGETTIAAGEYSRVRSWFSAATPSVLPVSFRTTVQVHGYYDGGRLFAVDANIVVRPTALLRFELTGRHNRVTFDDATRNFHSDVLSGRLDLGFTPRLGLSTFFFWNSAANLVRVQSRLRWIYRPRSDLFVVYQHDVDDSTGGTTLSSLVVKATFRWP